MCVTGALQCLLGVGHDGHCPLLQCYMFFPKQMKIGIACYILVTCITAQSLKEACVSDWVFS